MADTITDRIRRPGPMGCGMIRIGQHLFRP